MHTQAIVTFNKDKAKNSEEARKYASDFLFKNGFTAQVYFCSGIADWFVIGGRWSGCLSKAKGLDRRDNYKSLGYEDDAMIVDENIYNEWLKPFDGRNHNKETFWDLNCYFVSEDFIGNKWIVVVDYHT